MNTNSVISGCSAMYIATMADQSKTRVAYRDDDIVFLDLPQGSEIPVLVDIVSLDLIMTGKDEVDEAIRATRPDYLPQVRRGGASV